MVLRSYITKEDSCADILLVIKLRNIDSIVTKSQCPADKCTFVPRIYCMTYHILLRGQSFIYLRLYTTAHFHDFRPEKLTTVKLLRRLKPTLCDSDEAALTHVTAHPIVKQARNFAMRYYLIAISFIASLYEVFCTYTHTYFPAGPLH